MTQENKELLKDLCARLPYEVIVECSIESGESIDLILNTSHIDELVNDSLIIKPYLRPMSSMTKEERKIYAKLLFADLGGVYEDYYKALDYLNSLHIDYRGLINKGLALEAPVDMYNLKDK